MSKLALEMEKAASLQEGSNCRLVMFVMGIGLKVFNFLMYVQI